MGVNSNNIKLDGNWFERVSDHAAYGLSYEIHLKDGQTDHQHTPNMLERGGNGILWTLGTVPRAVEWIGKQFKDPRVLTVVLTITALALTTLAFYPTITTAAISSAFFAVKALLSEIPLWAVKFAAYVVTCAAIVGYGARAAGRFSNEESMKAFYNLPQSYSGNPANLSIKEIEALKLSLETSSGSASASSDSARSKEDAAVK